MKVCSGAQPAKSDGDDGGTTSLVPFPILRLRLSPVFAFPLDSECDRRGLMPLIGSSPSSRMGPVPPQPDYAVSNWRACGTRAIALDRFDDSGKTASIKLIE